MAHVRKAGRCFNGFESDGGKIIHHIADRPKGTGGDWFGKATCGSQPGYRGNGWSETDKPVTCPKCLKKLEKITAKTTDNEQH